MKKIILLDTRDGKRLFALNNDGKSVESTSKVQFDLNKLGFSTKTIQSIGMHTIEMPNLFYNITSRNNKLVWTVSGNVYTATLDPGYYTEALLLPQLQAKLTAINTLFTYVFVKNTITHVLEVTASDVGGAVAFQFHYSESTIGNVLGWTEDDPGSSPKRGNRPLDLRGVTSVLIKCTGDKAIPPNIFTTSNTNDTFLYQALIDVPFGSTVFHRAQTGMEQFSMPKINLDGKLIFELLNRNREPIYINNFNWRVSILITYLEH